MPFHLLNINEESSPSMLVGQRPDREGTPLTVLYELRENGYQDVQPYLDDLLDAIGQGLGTAKTETVLVYQRLRYSGVWCKIKPLVEPQDTQSLDFLGFDADEMRPLAQDSRGLGTIHVRIDGLAKKKGKDAMLAALGPLWEQSSDVNDFKARVAAWNPTGPSKEMA